MDFKEGDRVKILKRHLRWPKLDVGDIVGDYFKAMTPKIEAKIRAIKKKERKDEFEKLKEEFE